MSKINGNLIITNANIWEHKESDTIIIENGVVKKICKGTNLENISSKYTYLDIEGRMVIPGLADAHMHLYGYSLSLMRLDLRGTMSIEELKKRLYDFYRRKKAGWIIGRGWDQENFIEKRLLTRQDLDEVVPNKPVILVRVCGHLATLNSRAIHELNLEHKFSGNPNFNSTLGIVREEVLEYVIENIKSKLNLENYLIEVQNELISCGITSVGFMNVDLNVLSTLIKLYLEGKLKIRVFVYLSKDTFQKLVNEFGLVPPIETDKLKLNGVKIFIDGSLGARTAYLSEPYEDDVSNVGVKVMSEYELRQIYDLTSKQNLQLAIHAIGDKALDIVIDTLGKSLCRNVRIEHASLIRDDQLRLLSEWRPIIVVQPHFIITDWWVVKRVGIRRASWVYRFKSMIDHGLTIAFSSDAPVEPFNPWETIYVAITRGEFEGIELSKYTQSEKLSIIDCLDAYTRGSALALNSWSTLGSLNVNKFADFVIYDKDPLSLGIDELRKLKPKATFIEGELVYGQI